MRSGIYEPGGQTRVKGVLTPNLLSTFRTTGIFSPFTYEANINMQMPELYFPAVAAHEYAHLKGFAGRMKPALSRGMYVQSQKTRILPIPPMPMR